MKPVRKAIINILNECGAYHFPNKAGMYAKRGIPDLTAIFPNKVIFIEIKEKGDRLSEIQKVVFNKIRSYGIDVLVATHENIEEVRRQLYELGSKI